MEKKYLLIGIIEQTVVNQVSIHCKYVNTELQDLEVYNTDVLNHINLGLFDTRDLAEQGMGSYTDSYSYFEIKEVQTKL